MEDYTASILQKCVLFSELEKEVLIRLMDESGAYSESYSAGAEITYAECDCRRVGIVLRGKAYVFSQEKQKPVLLNRLLPGSVFGMLSLFDTENAPTRVKSVCETTVLFIGAKEFLRLAEQKEIARNLILFLADRIHFLNRKISAFTAPCTESRVAIFLLESAGDKTEFQMEKSFTELSRTLDIGRASLYRAFDFLENEKIIRKDGKKIILLEKQKLENII